MSVVIVGGNECMERQYKELCKKYECKAKVYPKTKSNMKSIGQPDLLVLFTNTVSHKMVRCALNAVKGYNIPIVRCHSSSANALKGILEQYAH
ncbi:hypothetical protein C815_00721 [Firmicutes bacterium M10-2]|nr:hypothetical protein C815_00721 [Firmicutes bacterium M10-2]